MQANQGDDSVVLVAESEADRAVLAILEANELGLLQGDSLAITVVPLAAVNGGNNSYAVVQRRLLLLKARKMRLSATLVAD